MSENTASEAEVFVTDLEERLRQDGDGQFSAQIMALLSDLEGFAAQQRLQPLSPKDYQNCEKLTAGAVAAKGILQKLANTGA
ncbi:EscE/YscE/SsaE family type III secretion system needle protein co-chaperone [Polycladidibacter hongkongensis]|uniref:EscE/YscE/SsaE family type III secretion system needle protein co-chaperone n=1 Tax=Polycladidibacter hongkongensis TaxID=1647556 RepID=UPI00082EE158|nr:hypothetical protein [Pseudovibrio hongkongensis]